jgi:protocatechuate 3,4-dioxygenase beta subunit
VENVYVQSAAAGTWSVQVSGFNVPNGAQPFALVVDGTFGAGDNPPSVTITYPADGATVSGTINITADASDDNGVTQVEFFVDGGSIGVDATAPYEATWDSTTVADGNYTITAMATDTIDQTGSDSNNVTVDNVLDPTVHVGDLDGSSAEAPRGRWDATVTITIHDSSEAAVADALVEGNWSNGATGGALCTTNASGQCSVSKANLKSNVPSVAFSVSNVTSSAGAYVPGDNHDPEGDSNGTTITVLQPSSNTPPTANITQPADGTTFASGATINFAGTANDAEDGDITANLVWTSNIDGQIGSGGSFSAVLSDGVHTITASATDSGGATGSDSIDITVGTVVTVVMHIGDLDGSSASAARNRWDATVVITVHDESHGPVENATVDGSWSAGATGGGSCVTNASGQCSVTKTNIKGNVGSVTFTVNDVTRGSDTYSGVNHDPDGDSDGTTITVLQP